MILEHRNRRPRIHPSAYVAPNAIVAGDVRLEEDARVLFGAVLTAEGGPVRVGARSIVMENAVIRGAPGHPAEVGSHVLIGPRAYVTGATVRESAFLATGVAVFNGAVIGEGAELRVNAVVHVRTRVADGATVPIGWVAVGDPAELFPPERHEEIWERQRSLDFPGTVFGMERAPNEDFMPEMTRRYGRALGAHRDDRPLRDREPGVGVDEEGGP